MDERLLALIAQIYEAAIEPGRWPAFLSAYAALVDAPSALFLYSDLRRHGGGISLSIGVDPEALRRYADYYAALDPWLYGAQARGMLRPGVPIIGEDVAPRAQLVKTEYYNDLARPFGITRPLSAVIRQDRHLMFSVSAFRADSSQPFGERERELLRILLPHLDRAMQVHRRISGTESQHEALLEALDRMPFGVMVVRDDSTIALANRTARLILEAGDGLTSSASGLRAAVPAEHAALSRLIHDTADTAAGRGRGSGGTLAITRPSLKPPLAVLVAPCPGGPLTPWSLERFAAVVFVTDPEREVQADVDVMRQIWRLTPTEATIAASLAAGRSVRQVADELAITEGTARWHVKRVLAKAGVSRQADLVRLMTLSAAILRP